MLGLLRVLRRTLKDAIEWYIAFFLSLGQWLKECIPGYNSWLIGGDTFTALLPSVRMIWCAGFYGSGKTVLAYFLSAYLAHNGLAQRVVSNIDVSGKSPAIERVPEGSRYYSTYLEKWYYPGDMLPLEDSAILFDEAALFMDDWQVAKDYFMALRKTNLYMLMPSIWSPAARLRSFEVRRVWNLYALGIPAWRFKWFLNNGRSYAEKGTFILWRPHRLFGGVKTTAFPEDDGGIAEVMAETFHLDKVQNAREKIAKRRKTTTFDFGASAVQDAAADFAAVFDNQQAWAERNNKRS